MIQPDPPPGHPAAFLQRPSPALVLASGSATRLALLRAAGLSVQVRAPAVDEAAVKAQALAAGGSAADAATALAEAKALRLEASDALVIGGDQILTCDGAWFDKPPDRAAARRHLQALRGRPHVLHTAVVLCRQGRVVWRHLAEPALAMRALTDAFIDAYLELEGDAVLSSVGAYRLEGPGIQLFERIEGEHAAILGLPMLPLLAELRARGVLAR